MIKFLIVTLMACCPSNLLIGGQQVPSSECQPVRRFETGCGYDCLTETGIAIGGMCTKNPDDILAVRICSKEPLLPSLYKSAANPLFVASYLVDFYKYSPERIIFLRSEDCKESASKTSPTEYWVIPRGGAMPKSVESINYSQLQVDSLATFSAGARDYQAALRDLPDRLNKSPESIGMVLGYYIKKPSPVLGLRLREVTKTLESKGVPRDRYFIFLTPWTGERSESPPAPEPKYPSVFVLKVEKD